MGPDKPETPHQRLAFPSCRAYEEFFRGHTLRQFLNSVGVPISANRMLEVQGTIGGNTKPRRIGSLLSM